MTSPEPVNGTPVGPAQVEASMPPVDPPKTEHRTATLMLLDSVDVQNDRFTLAAAEDLLAAFIVSSRSIPVYLTYGNGGVEVVGALMDLRIPDDKPRRIVADVGLLAPAAKLFDRGLELAPYGVIAEANSAPGGIRDITRFRLHSVEIVKRRVPPKQIEVINPHTGLPGRKKAGG